MKKFIIFTLMAIMLTACGNDGYDTNTTTTTEFASSEEDTYTYDDEGSVEKESASDDAAEAEEEQNTTEDNTSGEADNTDIANASPIDGVSNAVFVDVSSAVRNNCNSKADGSSSELKSNWSNMIKTEEERIYSDTAIRLIDSYGRLNKCRNLIYENNDVVTDEDIALLTEIEDGLGANVEIFLNTNTTSIMSDADFDYSNELSKLELSINNKVS